MIRYSLEVGTFPVEEMDDEEEEIVQTPSRNVILRDRFVSLDNYILSLLYASPKKQLSLSELIHSSGFTIKRLSKKLAQMEKFGMIQSQVINKRRSFVKVFRVTSGRCKEYDSLIGERPTKDKQMSDQSINRKQRILAVV